MTRLYAYFLEALASLWRNRVRSILTMLGMVIGSASIIAVFGISTATTSGIGATFASFGVLPVSIVVDNSQDDPDLAQIHYRDVASVATALGDRAAAVEPSWNRDFLVSVGSHRDVISITTDGSYHADALVMAEGRKIDDDDLTSAAHVCVITHDLSLKYFAGSAVGNFLRINGARYAVIGVYADIKGSFFNSIAGSSGILIPYTTYHNELTTGPVDILVIYPRNPLQADTVGQAAVHELQHVHGERAKYQVQNNADGLETFESVLGIVGAGLSAIGGVALVVAGIGIMNIMLVSVTERTREIGIRKSIGANRGDIALQFLMESVLLSMAGGGLGMSLGLLGTIGAASIISRQLGAFIIPYLLIVSIAVSFSFLVGTVFGTYPAFRAARMDPIEALRS